MKRIIPMFCLAVGSSMCAKSQLYIDNATFTIEQGATVTVQGDLTSNTNIQGAGKILLKGTALQNVNMNSGGATTNAYTIPNLEIDNAANVVLKGNLRVGSSLVFTNGKVQAGDFNFTIGTGATTTGMAAGKFIETNGTGMVQREITTATSNVLMPTGFGTSYAPVSLSHSGGTYTSTSVLSAQAKAGLSPNAPIRSESYTNVYWPVTSSNITGGTYTATGTYPGISSLASTTPIETDIYGMSYNGTSWSRTGGGQNYTNKTVTAQLAGNSGQQLFGMNRFLLLNTRVILQGAYDSVTTFVMNDGLRSGGNVIPTTEPYRSIYTSVAGSTQEVVDASVFADQAVSNNNLVDWIFVELRDNATPSTLLQTRSVFVQRDGDVVDVDGINPVYFKNLDPNDFTITVRHRNHLPISTNNAGNFFKGLSLAPGSVLDFTTLSTTGILGDANVNYIRSNTGSNMMCGGNANGNTTVRYSSGGNDAAAILTVLGGNTSGLISNTYNTADVNMNKAVRYSSGGNDAAAVLRLLGNNVSGNRSQKLPQ